MRLWLWAVGSLLMITGALSQDGARAYHLLPEGTRIMSLYATHQDVGSMLDVNVFTSTYLHSVDVLGNAGAIVVGLPLGNLSLALDSTTETTNLAQGDLVVVGILGLLGSPSLAPMDYAQYKPGVRAGVVAKLYLPTGDYDSDSLLNLGSNRWSLQASLPLSYVLAETMVDPALTTFELMPAVHIFGDNEDPYGGPSVTSQAPLFSLEGHVTRNFGGSVWASLDGLYKFGGETSADGVGLNNAQDSLTLGATLGLSPTPSLSLRLSYDEMVYSNVPGAAARSINLVTSVLF